MEPPASSRDVASVGLSTCWAGIVGKNSLVQQFNWASKLDMAGPVSLVHPWCPRWYEWTFVYNSSGTSLSVHKWGSERRQRPGPKQRTNSKIIINNTNTTTNNNAMGIKWKGTWVWSLLSTLLYLLLSSSPSFSLCSFFADVFADTFFSTFEQVLH